MDPSIAMKPCIEQVAWVPAAPHNLGDSSEGLRKVDVKCASDAKISLRLIPNIIRLYGDDNFSSGCMILIMMVPEARRDNKPEMLVINVDAIPSSSVRTMALF